MNLKSGVVGGVLFGVCLACSDSDPEAEQPVAASGSVLSSDAHASSEPSLPIHTTAATLSHAPLGEPTAATSGPVPSETLSTAAASTAAASATGTLAAGGAPGLPTASAGAGGGPDDVPPPAPFPELPIAIYYLGLTDQANGVVEFAAPADFSACPKAVVLDRRFEMSEQPLWSECAATLATAELNRAFQELLNTDQVLFESKGYSTVESPENATFEGRDEVELALDGLNLIHSQPNSLTALISNWIGDGGGLAPRDMPIDAENGAAFAISQNGLVALIHEVGHVMGLLHTDEDLLGTGELSYDACEPLTAPLLADCNCEFNFMEATTGEGRCPQCEQRPYSFDTETHGQFFRDVLDCWLRTRRFLGQEIVCTLPDAAECVGFENDTLECICQDGETLTQLSSCENASAAELTAVYEECGVDPSVDLTGCYNFNGYPGIYCVQQEGAPEQCQCLDDNSVFTSETACAEISEQEIYATCLAQDVAETCKGTSPTAELRCVETVDGEFNCMCTNNGGTLVTQAGDACGELDLDTTTAICEE